MRTAVAVAAEVADPRRGAVREQHARARAVHSAVSARADVMGAALWWPSTPSPPADAPPRLYRELYVCAVACNVSNLAPSQQPARTPAGSARAPSKPLMPTGRETIGSSRTEMKQNYDVA